VHNEELCDLYSSPSIIRIIRSTGMMWVGHVQRMGENRNVYRLLEGKQEGKKPLRRPRHRWANKIKMDLVEIGQSRRPRLTTVGTRFADHATSFYPQTELNSLTRGGSSPGRFRLRTKDKEFVLFFAET
jgi:hypothetical protein